MARFEQRKFDTSSQQGLVAPHKAGQLEPLANAAGGERLLQLVSQWSLLPTLPSLLASQMPPPSLLQEIKRMEEEKRALTERLRSVEVKVHLLITSC